MRSVPARYDFIRTSGGRSDLTGVVIDHPDATDPVNLRDILGEDWCLGVSWGEEVNSPGMTASIKVKRNIYENSLAPLVESLANYSSAGTPLPVIAVGRAIGIYASAQPDGVVQEQVSDDDWMLAFDGYIDRIEWGSDAIMIECRDQLAPIQDAWVRVPGIYPSVADLRSTEGDSASWSATGSAVIANYTADYWMRDGCVRATAGAPLDTVSRVVYTSGVSGQTYKVTCRVRRIGGTGSDLSVWLEDSAGNPGTARDVVLANTDGWVGLGMRPRAAVVSTGTDLVIEVTAAANGAVSLFVELGAGDEDILIDDIQVVDSTPSGSAGSPATGTPMEDAIQDILDTWVTGVTLNVPTSPSFYLQEWEQDPMSAYDAIQRIAAIIGWEVRYVWDDASTAFKLTLQSPDRAAAVADRTFTSADYFDDGLRVEQDRANVRNVVRVIWYDEDGIRHQVTRKDTTSIAEYGERWMEVTEGTSSPIDSESEAEDFADAIIDDLATPELEQQIPMVFFPWVQLHDYYTVEANGITYSTDQTLGVQGYTHTDNRDGNGVRTMMVMRGKPSTGARRWLAMESRPGNAPYSSFTTAPIPYNPPSLGKPVVGYMFVGTDTAPLQWPHWDYSEVHISSVSGFSPDATTLLGIMKASSAMLDVNGYASGSYFVKVRHRDRKGNYVTSKQSGISL